MSCTKVSGFHRLHPLRSLLPLSLSNAIFIDISPNIRLTEMRRKLLDFTFHISPGGHKESNSKEDWSSPRLDNARTVCQLLSNLGSGGISVPGLQAAGLVAVQIIDIVKKTKGNKTDCEDLVTRIVQLLDPIGKTLQNQGATDIDLRLTEDLERFTEDLEKIRDILKRQADRSIIRRAANSVGDGEDILRCKELIDQGFKRFEVYTSISLRMDTIYLRRGLESLRLLNTHPSEAPSPNTTNDGCSPPNSFPPSQPLAPEIFFGRDDIISEFTSLVVRDEQTRLAILGTGGIGKTSTALHILHHREVVSRYDNQRYFVGCDAVYSAESLATLILQIIQVPPVAGENVLTILHRALLAAPLTLLLLDNFETVWEINSRRDEVLDLLRKIVNSKRVSLIITMRGAIPPPGIIWTRFQTLPPLLPPDAKSLFLAINSPLNAGDDEHLDTLLAEMDYVPLAVLLLAQVSIGFSSRYMVSRWREKQTELLCTHKATPGKLESIEVSISLSLATLEITSNPDAVQLLGILCQLPDGLRQWEERLPRIWTGRQSVHDLVHVLHKTALLFIAGSALKVLSPIRHFINRHHQTDIDHIKSLEGEFWSLVDRYAATEHGPGFPHARNMIEPEMGNIRSLIKHATETHPSAHLVEVILKVSQFLMNTVPSTELLNSIMVTMKQVGSLMQQARVLQLAGELLYLQVKDTEASESLTEVRRQFLEIGSILGVAQCSQSLGNILRMRSKYTEASETLTEARKQFLEIGDTLGAAQCSHGLGEILRMQSKYAEASETLAEARRQFLEIGNVLGAAQCMQSLGEILRLQSKYTEASEALTKARKQFLEIGDVLGAAQCSRSLGDILHMQSKYTEASETLAEARSQCLEIGYTLGVAQCSRSLGDILRLQSKYTEASETLAEARRQFLEIGDTLGAAQCTRSLGDILRMQSKYTEALETLTEARRQFLEIGDVLGVAQCSQPLGDILRMQSKYTEASETLTEARKQSLEIGDVFGAAQCTQSLGKIFHMQSKYTEASEALTEARRQYIDIGHVLGTAQCSRSLGEILYIQSKYTEALETLTEARSQFLGIGHVHDAAGCSQILDDIICMQDNGIAVTD